MAYFYSFMDRFDSLGGIADVALIVTLLALMVLCWALGNNSGRRNL